MRKMLLPPVIASLTLSCFSAETFLDLLRIVSHVFPTSQGLIWQELHRDLVVLLSVGAVGVE